MVAAHAPVNEFDEQSGDKTPERDVTLLRAARSPTAEVAPTASQSSLVDSIRPWADVDGFDLFDDASVNSCDKHVKSLRV